MKVNFKMWKGKGLMEGTPGTRRRADITEPEIEGGRQGSVWLGTYVALPPNVATGLLDRACLGDKIPDEGEFIIFESSTADTEPDLVDSARYVSNVVSVVMVIAHEDKMWWLVAGTARLME
jgi:F420-0:gamma-glutamyl ligase-like protein